MTKKILIVDDEPDIVKITNFRLKKLGYETETAANGKEALDLLKTNTFDLIFLDLRMPVLDGYETCKIIKADDKLKDIPIIVFSASTSQSSESIKIQLDITDVLIKPFEPEDLISKVKNLIGEP